MNELRVLFSLISKQRPKKGARSQTKSLKSASQLTWRYFLGMFFFIHWDSRREGPAITRLASFCSVLLSLSPVFYIQLLASSVIMNSALRPQATDVCFKTDMLHLLLPCSRDNSKRTCGTFFQLSPRAGFNTPPSPPTI